MGDALTGIVVDSSVLLALEFAEPSAEACARALAEQQVLWMSTVNLTEVLIRATDRNPRAFEALADRLAASEIRFVAPDAAQARIAAQARLRFPLNLGDCFAYALAVTNNCPILSLDLDFRSTGHPVIVPWESPGRPASPR